MQVSRIAVWSGPRNISTAMMRAWENRGDCRVADEPFYAHYLTRVTVSHPGVDEVIAHHEPDWEKVAAWLLGPVPGGHPVFYQKHMAHHWLPHLRGEWLFGLSNCFLIRHPAEMLPSLAQKMGPPALRDTGLPQQVELFRTVWERTGAVPPVLDAEDVLKDPRAILSRLCEAVGVPFTDRMLRWPPGRRETDGVWARYWYDAVERSTGFEPWRERDRTVPAELTELLSACLPLYDELAAHRMRAH
jgi:hypothetical protein